MLGKLPIFDRLLAWVLLYTSSDESHTHLFFACSFDVTAWCRVRGRFISYPPLDLTSIVDIGLHFQGSHEAPKPGHYIQHLERQKSKNLH